MLTTYEAVFKNGQINWLDNPQIAENATLHITVINNNSNDVANTNDNAQYYDLTKKGEQRWGFLKGQAVIPDEIADDDPDWYPKSKRIGMMEGQAVIPDDIHWGDDEIMRMFGFSEEEIAQTYPDKARLNKN